MSDGQYTAARPWYTLPRVSRTAVQVDSTEILPVPLHGYFPVEAMPGWQGPETAPDAPGWLTSGLQARAAHTQAAGPCTMSSLLPTIESLPASPNPQDADAAVLPCTNQGYGAGHAERHP